MPTSSQIVTADELLRLPSGRFRYTVTIHYADGRSAALDETDVLDGGDLISGFACRVGEIFPA